MFIINVLSLIVNGFYATDVVMYEIILIFYLLNYIMVTQIHLLFFEIIL